MTGKSTDFSEMGYDQLFDKTNAMDTCSFFSIGDIKEMFENRIFELVNENIDNFIDKSEICNNMAKIEELRRLLESLR